MRGALTAVMLCAAGVALSLRPATSTAREALDPGAACRTLQQAIAKRDGLPESGPPGTGWFCDIVPSRDPAFYVIALRAGKPDPYGKLFGWFAVARATGTIHGWDVAKQRAMPLKAPGQAPAPGR
jgi:hypothetical protein